ncbi:MAG: peptide chain release factor N(5)-glutamine methyltransferase [Clostridium sp.]|nr:peptide chain release factor N(5)-glutamine methyltransferase [Clostridium sp.]
MTIRDMKQHLQRMLEPSVDPDEARAMALAIMEDVRGYKAVDIAINGNRELLPETEKRMFDIADKVVKGMPLQYAIGKALFRGRYFSVNPSTLIPRQETAQLVDIIVDDWNSKSDLKIMDIGTGSGCIAISLALDLPFAEVEAVDISPDALAEAKENASLLKASRVDFQLRDALKLTPEKNAYDIIASNPPYVLDSEKPQMDARVADYEPATALFVPDSDPVKFYRPISEFAAKSLRAGGKLYLEINPLCASAIQGLLLKDGFKDAQIQCDYKGARRFAIASI